MKLRAFGLFLPCQLGSLPVLLRNVSTNDFHDLCIAIETKTHCFSLVIVKLFGNVLRIRNFGYHISLRELVTIT